MYPYPALSNVNETVWQYICFALNKPIKNAIIFSHDSFFKSELLDEVYSKKFD